MVKELHEFIMECRQLDKVKITLACIFISISAGYHLQTVADHLIQSFIRFAGSSYIWHDNVHSGNFGGRYEGWCGKTFKLIYVSSGQRTLASVERVSHVRERCESGGPSNGDQLKKYDLDLCTLI
jgi:hypothetical protein